MAASVYVVTTTIGPQYRVSQAEYEQLLELNLVASLDLVFVPPDDVVASPTPPVSPAVGTVWANTTIPA